MNVEYPIISMIGDRGDGKTLTMTALAYMYHKLGFKIYANFRLINIPYEPITFEKLATFPDDLRDGVVLIDEAHIGADAYQVFRQRVQDITKFTTQLRKRRIILYFSTQIFTTVAKRLRQLTNYIFECNKTDIKGVIRVNVFDRSMVINGGYINTFIMDGRQFFDYYDTNEIIELHD